MASSSYKTFLMHKNSDAYEKLVDIKDFPDLGGEPEMLETTTLSDSMQTFIEGIQSSEALEFTINYDLETYKTISEMKGTEKEFAVWFGGTETAGTVTPTGGEGKFEFKGYISIRVGGKGVNEVKEATISIAPSTPIILASE
jgi:hypothetical protein